MSWYEKWFDTDEYDLVYQNRDSDEAERLVDLILDTTGLPPGASVLDVGCGRGRHSLVFATRGYRVTGLDLSGRALEIAARKAARAGLPVELRQGDMRNPIEGSFDLVVNLFTAFGYFERMDSHQAAVDAMGAAVAPAGWLVQDFLNAAHVRRSLVAEDVKQVGEVEIRQTRRIEEDRIRKRIDFIRPEGSHTFEESVALLERPDFETMYRHAGLRLKTVLGDYAGKPFLRDSPRTIMFARRA